jgi:hypothetical protein
MDQSDERNKPGKAPDDSAATGTGPAQPWDKQGRGPDSVDDNTIHPATGMAKNGDRRPEQDEEDELTDALEQTFPASDPVSAEQISRPGKPPSRDR